MRPPLNTLAIVAEIERIQRFVLPDSEVDLCLVGAIKGVRQRRGWAIALRPGVMPNLERALHLTADKTVKEELTTLVERMRERSRRVK